MDVAKVARDYFLSSQSSLLIPNREYGSRKLIHVGLGRSNSAGNVLKNNSNSNVNKSQLRDDEDDSDIARSKRSGIFPNTRASRTRPSLSGVQEENGGQEYQWRTVSSGSTEDSPAASASLTSEELYPSSSFSAFSTPSENLERTGAGITENANSPVYATVSKRDYYSAGRSASLSALSPPPSSLSSSSSSPSTASPRPRPGSTSASSSGAGGGFGTLKGLLGASNSSGVREKALAMKSGKLIHTLAVLTSLP